MGSEAGSLSPFLAPLRNLVAWFKKERVSGVIIGGLAASLLGRPRATRDIDALILLPEERWAHFLNQGNSFRFEPRVSDALAFAHEARVLLIRHEPSGIDCDLTLGALPFEEEVIKRAAAVHIGDFTISLPTPDDLIVMKIIANRPRDLADIAAILDAQPILNIRRMRRWVREFASNLDMPNLLVDLDHLLAQRPKAKNKRKKP